MTTTPDSLLARLNAVACEAWGAGYAITFWAPEELGDVDATQLIDIVVERGNDYLASRQDSEEYLP